MFVSLNKIRSRGIDIYERRIHVMYHATVSSALSATKALILLRSTLVGHDTGPCDLCLTLHPKVSSMSKVTNPRREKRGGANSAKLVLCECSGVTWIINADALV